MIGLGLIGQLTLDLVAGVGGVALGFDTTRVALARDAGYWATMSADELAGECRRRTSGHGADAALVTAAARSAAQLATAIACARERATICIVGDVLAESLPTPLFAKELKLVVSRSYSPGGYDPVHEELGQGYPAWYVRRTEGRTLEEVLRLMSVGRLKRERLTTHTFDLPDGPAAYRLLESEPTA